MKLKSNPLFFFFLLSALFIFSGNDSFATIYTAVTGNFNQSSTWTDPDGNSHTPGNGDTLLIPVGVTVTITAQEGTFSDMRIHVKGQLDFQNGKKLNLSSNGIVDVAQGGSLTGNTNGQGTRIQIGNSVVWTGSDITAVNEAYTCVVSGCGNGQLIAALPIELLYFNAKEVDGLFIANWATAAEKNNDYFSLDFSPNGQDWIEHAIESGSGNSNSEQYYSIEINSLHSTERMNYVRLSQTDFDGTNEIVATQVLERSTQVKRSVYPNPTSGAVKVSHEIGDVLVVKSLTGASLLSLTLENSEITTINLQNYLNNGCYILVISSENDSEAEPFVTKLVIN